MIAQLFLIAFGTLVSEDLTCIAAGVLISQGELGLMAGTGACFAGILAGDLLLFFVGRVAGRQALSWRPLAKVVSSEAVTRASAWYERRGATIVLLSRFTPGLRLPTYFAAGLLRTQFWRFAGYFIAAAAVWTPLLVGGTVVIGEQTSRTLIHRGSNGSTLILLALALAFYGAGRALFTRRIARAS